METMRLEEFLLRTERTALEPNQMEVSLILGGKTNPTKAQIKKIESLPKEYYRYKFKDGLINECGEPEDGDFIGEAYVVFNSYGHPNGFPQRWIHKDLENDIASEYQKCDEEDNEN